VYLDIAIVYVAFLYLLSLHVFEEIEFGIFKLKVHNQELGRTKYLLGASLINTITFSSLFFLLLEYNFALYMILFSSLFFGVLQFFVHSFGFIKNGTKSFGKGFYTAILLGLLGSYMAWITLMEIL